MKRLMRCVLLVLLIALVSAGCQKGPGQLTLYGINTGKADCLLFRLPNGETLMVDTGLKGTYAPVKAVLEMAQVRKIDHLILTHGHKDHMGGLKQLAKDYQIGTIYTNAYDTATYNDSERTLLSQAAAAWKQIYPVVVSGEKRGGASLSFGAVKADFLAPARPYRDTEDDNNNSLVLRLTHGTVRLLLMADATSLIEEELLSNYEPEELKADFLKAGRHGKADANTQAFIEAVSPEAVYLTGNRADDVASPDEAVLERYAAVGAEAYSNEGDHLAIAWVSDGTSLSQGKYINAK